MNRSIILWIAAFLITMASAVYQRMTGPTYPVAGTTTMRGVRVDFALERSHGGNSDALVRVPVRDSSVHAFLEWKRYNSDDPLTKVPMHVGDGGVEGALPHQPPGGKVEYRVLLDDGVESIALPDQGFVVMRFKGDVPVAVLLPHILAMFIAMLISTRAGLECLSRQPNFGKLVGSTIALLTVGGIILGPLVQRYAFGAWWTGWPFGGDLTDNKTAVALVGWLAAAAALKRSRFPRAWVLGASVLTLVVFLIPHSLFGTELDYRSMPKESARAADAQIHWENWEFSRVSQSEKNPILEKDGDGSCG